MNPHASHLTLARSIRWTARVTSALCIGMLGLFAFGGRETSPLSAAPQEMLLLVFFPLGVVAGMVLAWWKEIPGAIVSLASLAAFYAVCAVVSHKLPGGPYFAIFTAPAMLFLASGLLSRQSSGQHTAA